MSSQALVREKEVNGSGEETLTVGVEGEAVPVAVSSSVVTEGVVSVRGADGVGVISSAKTRVGFDWFNSQGNIGDGRSFAGRSLGTS